MVERQAFYQPFRSLSKDALTISFFFFFIDISVHNPKTIATVTSKIWQTNGIVPVFSALVSSEQLTMQQVSKEAGRGDGGSFITWCSESFKSATHVIVHNSGSPTPLLSQASRFI